MNNAELLENYSKRLGSKGKTRNLYLRFVGDFLDYAEGVLDRETVDKYMKNLKRKKYSDGTINLHFRVIRTLFSRNKIDWPFNRGESPQIREDNIQAPALHIDLIAKMIKATRENGEPDERAFLALSTIYGLRRIEMVELTEKDVRIKDRTVHITTAKHGRERTHLIPEEIVPCLRGYDFNSQMTEFGLLVIWYKLEYKIGLAHIDRVGWHSIRRMLDTLLLDQLPQHRVMSFMRWKQRTSSNMPYRYSAVQIVGEEGMSTRVAGEAAEVDKAVFDIHPFIEFWR